MISELARINTRLKELEKRPVQNLAPINAKSYATVASAGLPTAPNNPRPVNNAVSKSPKP
jgi:hypothetical protein